MSKTKVAKLLAKEFFPECELFSIAKDAAEYFRSEADTSLTLLETITSMFNYYDFPEEVNTDFLASYSLVYGMCCIIQNENINNGKPTVAMFKPVGERDAYGIGKDAIVSTKAPEVVTVKDWRESDDLVVFFLNRIYTSDLSVPVYGKMINEARTTINTILKNARYAKMLGVKDDKTKRVVDDALSNMEIGKPTTVVDEASANNFVGAEHQLINSIELFDVRNNDMLQYLSKFIDDTERQFYTKYGLSSYGSSKMAQQNSDEITSGLNRAMTIPHMRYERWQRFAEECNKKFGWNCSIEFSECWQNELARCEEDTPEAAEVVEESSDNINEEVDEDEEMEYSQSDE